MPAIIPHDVEGIPDDESPEWTDEDFLWSVKLSDFDDIAALHAFLDRRAKFLITAQSVGFDRDTFLAFGPSKPGFLDRVEHAIAELLSATRPKTKHAAE